jgi:glycosyltransferase involved in cell wall biosynthesis
VIVHSSNAKRILIDEWKFPHDKIEIIPLGLPAKIHLLNKEFCKKKLGFSSKKILLIYGYARGYKNYEMVIKCLSKLPEEVVLIITGATRQKKHQKVYENMLRRIKELNLEKRIKITGFVEESEIPILFGASDIGILPYTKTFGDFSSASMAEQLAYQVPILAADIHPFESFKRINGCVATFDKNDMDDFINKLKTLLYNKIKSNALKKEEKKYWQNNKWDKIALKYKKLYEELANSK